MRLYDDPSYGEGDDLKIYMSMRGNGHPTKEEYLARLEPGRQERLKHEIERIDKLRKKFFANPTKKAITADHRERRREWKEEARASQARNLKDVDERITILDARGLQPGIDVNKEKRMLLNQHRILVAIKDWPTDDDPSSESSSNIPLVASEDKPDYGLKACIMHFVKGGGGHTHIHKHKKVIGNFPNQKISVDELLTKSEDNPLNEECPPNRLRYFHLPTNNMAWIEQVLACYYNEDLSDHDPSVPPYEHGPAKRLLAREYWKGQMHGGSEHPVHARHMRHRFSSVSSKVARTTISRRTSTVIGPRDQSPPSLVKPLPKTFQNFALFMPYLHWETNSRRSKMAEVVNELAKTNKVFKVGQKPAQKEKARADFFNAVEQGRLRAKYKDRLPSRSKFLGPYLMSIAKLYDEMDYEADERLLRDHLHQTPPLHIRRTLDQSYFWTLEDTTSRDKDQVVYRGTKGGKNWNARVVMVDQLWLWILDEHTILTSFPRRWGRNKPDPSGVHKSLRERLSHLEDDRINSVFDLALIIIDQCSRVFFDRTKPIDQRPEVMDIFSNTIAHVTGMKTIAFETFWSQMRMDSLKDPLAQSENSAIRAYLNVNPEGALLRECQDIVEELRMMSRIFTQQSQVVKDFKKALEKLNEKDDRMQESTASLRKILQDSESIGSDNTHYSRVPKSTIINAGEVLEQILERRTEIDELEEAAKRTSQQLQDLLTLKQQQASIIEARMALKRADLSIHQNRSIMLFTIVTIFFLPLSFFTSIFSMNNIEWEKNPMSMHSQFRFMFPISFAVISFSLLIAFSIWTRSLFSMVRAVVIAFVVENSPLPWIQELQWLSSQKFAEIEWKATKKIEDKRVQRQKRIEEMQDQRRRKRDEEKAKLAKKQHAGELRTAERQMSSDGKNFAWVRRRTERWRGAGEESNGGATETSEEVFGKV